MPRGNRVLGKGAVAKNRNQVPAADLASFDMAYVSVMREQIRSTPGNMSAAGTKFELYTRLKSANYQLYNIPVPIPAAPALAAPPQPAPNLRDFPVELFLLTWDDYSMADIWNMAVAADTIFVTRRLNVFVLEARDHRPGVGPRFGNLSLLEWVFSQGSIFHAAHSRLVRNLIGAYIDTLPGMDNGIYQFGTAGLRGLLRWINGAEHFSPPPGALVLRPDSRPLLHRIAFLSFDNPAQTVDIINMVLDVQMTDPNRVHNGQKALDVALLSAARTLDPAQNANMLGRLVPVVALIAGGTNPALLLGQESMALAQAMIPIVRPGATIAAPWPAIANPLAQTVRQFLRNPPPGALPTDPVTMALHLIGQQKKVYPGFVWE